MTAIEERVRQGLVAAADDYAPPPGLRAEVDRKVRRHRRARLVWGAAGLLGGLLFVAGLAALFATGEDGTESSGLAAPTAPTTPEEWRAVSAFELDVDAPVSWHVQPFAAGCNFGLEGVVLSNVADPGPRRLGNPCGEALPLETLPSGYVAVEISRDTAAGAPSTVATVVRDSQFPLAVDILVPLPDPVGGASVVVHGPIPVVIGGEQIAGVSVWVAAEPTPSDLATARQIVESIRPDG
jgi:hypothetical protein